MKVDISKIAGYADMTAEQKIAALEAFEMEPGEGYVAKSVLDKAAKDASDWKKKYNEKLTEQERQENEKAEALTKLQQERDELAKEVAVGRYKAAFISQGYTEELATATAEAMHAGDMQKVLDNQKLFLVEYDKKAKADAMKGMKPPTGGGEGGDDNKNNAAAIAKAIGQAASGGTKRSNEIMGSYLIK